VHVSSCLLVHQLCFPSKIPTSIQKGTTQFLFCFSPHSVRRLGVFEVASEADSGTVDRNGIDESLCGDPGLLVADQGTDTSTNDSTGPGANTRKDERTDSNSCGAAGNKADDASSLSSCRTSSGACGILLAGCPGRDPNVEARQGGGHPVQRISTSTAREDIEGSFAYIKALAYSQPATVTVELFLLFSSPWSAPKHVLCSLGMGRYAKDVRNLFRAVKDPEFREQQAIELQQQQDRRLQVGRWIFTLVLIGLGLLWLMNALGHPV